MIRLDLEEALTGEESLLRSLYDVDDSFQRDDFIQPLELNSVYQRHWGKVQRRGNPRPNVYPQ